MSYLSLNLLLLFQHHLSKSIQLLSCGLTFVDDFIQYLPNIRG
jgi:hypothetical protein